MDATPHMDATAPRKLYKSRRNRFIDGICGGIAEYFEVDPTIVRILWVLITLLGGSGIILYIVGMIVIPVNPEHIGQTPPVSPPTGASDRRRFFGVLIMLLGAFILLINLGWFAEFRWWSFSGSVMLPVLLILIGGLFIYLHTARKDATPNPAGQETAPPS